MVDLLYDKSLTGESVMFDPLTYLIYGAAGLTIFVSLLPLVVSIAYRGNPPPASRKCLNVR